MGIISSIAGGALSAVGGIFAAKKANKGYDAMDKALQARIDAQTAAMNKAAYQQAGQSADDIAAQTAAAKIQQEAQQRAKRSQYVTGGTDEGVAMQNYAAAASAAQMLQQQAVNAQARRDNALEQGTQAITGLALQQGQNQKDKYLGQAQAITGATKGLAESIKGINLSDFKDATKW